MTCVFNTWVHRESTASSRELGETGLSGRTVNYVRSMLVTALGDAVRWELVSRNVALDTERQEETEYEVIFWSPGELRTFLEGVRGERLHAAFHLAGMTGMRRGEVFGLRWSDVNLDESRLKVTQALVTVRHEPSFGKPKTKLGRRRIEFLTRGRLRSFASTGSDSSRSDLPGVRPTTSTAILFAKENGEPVHPESAAKVFDRRTGRSGLPRIKVPRPPAFSRGSSRRGRRSSTW